MKCRNLPINEDLVFVRMIGENTAIVNRENVSNLSIIDHFIPIHNANSDGNRDIINASSILDVYYFVLFFEGCLW